LTALIAWVLALAILVVFVQRAAFDELRSVAGRVFGILVALGLAIAVTSASAFVVGIWSDGLVGRTLIAESIAWIVLAAAGLLALPALRPGYHDLGEDPPALGRNVTAALCAAALVTTAVALYLLVGAVIARPHGSPDGWAIWNVRARFLALAPFDWTRALRVDRIANPDYPLLVPLINARIWSGLGAVPSAVPIGVALAFAAGIVAIATAGLAWLAGLPTALAAFVVLVGNRSLVHQASAQAADLPLALYYLAATALLVASDRALPRNRALALAAVAATAAAWTKNEGMVFAAAAALTVVLQALRRGGIPDAVRDARAFALGSIPIAAVLVMFKTRYAPPTNLVADHSLGHFAATLLDGSRHLTVLSNMAGEIVGGFGFSIAALVAWCLLVRTTNDRDQGRSGIHSAAYTLGITFFAYYLVYVTTSADLSWHLATSLDRLLFHFWPSLVFVGLAAVQRSRIT
jgi:hypothetical protein